MSDQSFAAMLRNPNYAGRVRVEIIRNVPLLAVSCRFRVVLTDASWALLGASLHLR